MSTSKDVIYQYYLSTSRINHSSTYSTTYSYLKCSYHLLLQKNTPASYSYKCYPLARLHLTFLLAFAAHPLPDPSQQIAPRTNFIPPQSTNNIYQSTNPLLQSTNPPLDTKSNPPTDLNASNSFSQLKPNPTPRV